MATDKIRTIDVENVNHPAQVKCADTDMHKVMRQAFLKIFPKTSSGLTLAEISKRLLAHLPEKLFPDGAKARWWRRPSSLIWRRKALLRARTPNQSACTKSEVASRFAFEPQGCANCVDQLAVLVAWICTCPARLTRRCTGARGACFAVD